MKYTCTNPKVLLILLIVLSVLIAILFIVVGAYFINGFSIDLIGAAFGMTSLILSLILYIGWLSYAVLCIRSKMFSYRCTVIEYVPMCKSEFFANKKKVNARSTRR